MKYRTLLAAAAAAVMTGCMTDQSIYQQENEISQTQKGTLDFAMALPEKDAASADSAVISVFSGNKKIKSVKLTLDGSTVKGIIESLPAGEKLTFTLTIYQNGSELYTGEASAVISSVQKNVITIKLKKKTGSAEIIGIFEDSDPLPLLWLPLTGNTNNSGSADASIKTSGVTFTKEGGWFTPGAYVTSTDPKTTTLEGSFTAAFWIKHTGADATIISKHPHAVGAPEIGWNIQIEDGSGALGGPEVYRRGVRFDMSDGEHGNWGVLACDGITSDNFWHHIAVVVDRGQKTAFMYADGKVIDTYSMANFGSVDNLCPMIIGTKYEAWGRFTGGLKDVRIYDRPLSSSEIHSIMQK